MSTNDKDAKRGRMGTIFGASIGFVAFLVFGAVPGLLYGGYMGLIMAGAIFGTPVEPTLITRIITGGGMVLGLLASISLFLVVGAVMGAAVTGIVNALTPAPAEEEVVKENS